MAKYRLTKPAYVPANGHQMPRRFEADAIIETDVVPAESWIALDDAARAAKAASERPFMTARNGVQSIDRRTGTVRVTRVGESSPRATPAKQAKPVDVAESPPARDTTARKAIDAHARQLLAISAEVDPAIAMLEARRKVGSDEREKAR